MKKISSIIERLNAQSLGTFGLLFASVTSIRLFIQIDRAVQKIWGGRKKGNRGLRYLSVFSLMFFVPMISAILLGWLSSFALKNFENLTELWTNFTFFRFLVLFAPVFYLIKFAPNQKVAWKSAFLSSFLTFIALIGAQKAFLWGTLNLFNYNQLYGSLAALPLFLIWLNIWWILMLSGFLFCSVHQSYSNKK